MRALVQRVKHASVDVEGKRLVSIAGGLLVFLGVVNGDEVRDALYLAEKVARLRIFSDDAGKMNRSVVDIGGEVLVVSQFTLAADIRRGRRPSFDKAAPQHDAERLYCCFVNRLEELGVPVKTGSFGKYMQISLINDGPVTILADTDELLGAD